MKRRCLIPDTDLEIFPIGLGTVEAGIRWDGADADRIFDTYVGAGGNLIDCAHVYNDWIPGEKARAERVLGDWLRRSGKRNEVILMTKGGHPDMTVPEPDLHKSRMSHADMVQDLEGSLMQMGVDCIDIYFYHRDDRTQSVEEEIETMQEFVKAGKIRYYACSNWDAERMIQADEYCKEKGYRGFVADQSLFNIGMKNMKPLADDTLGYIRGKTYQYHLRNERNLAMPYMANCSGFFHLYDAKGESAVTDSPYYTEENLRIAGYISALKEKYHCSVTQVILGYFYHQPFSCVPLYGSTCPEHITDACGTLEIPFEDKDYETMCENDAY